MKSIRRGQQLITIMLLLFLAGMVFLVWKLQSEASFYISHASTTSLGMVYDRNGDILFDPDATKDTYAADHFLDVGNLIGDDSRQMTNTLVAQNKDMLANFSFMLGEAQNGQASIHTTLDHAVNRKVYDAFGSKNGCAVAYNYVTGEIYVCLSKPSVNILNNYTDIDSLESGSLLCKVFYPTVPGSTQKISTTIAALETMGYDTLMEQHFDCNGSYLNASGQRIKCHEETGHGNQTVMEAFSGSCNPFYAQLVESSLLPLDDIIHTYKKMGYSVNDSEGTVLNVNGITCTGGSTTLEDAEDFDTQWGCMGQGETIVSPLQMMVWQSAIATGTGKTTMPYLIDYATKVNGDITAEAETKRSEQMFSKTTAESMRTIMNANGEKRYSSLLPGSVVGVKSGTAQVGEDKHENSLLTGYVNDASFPIAFCIVIEDRHEGEVSTNQIASTLLQSLKAALSE